MNAGLEPLGLYAKAQTMVEQRDQFRVERYALPRKGAQKGAQRLIFSGFLFLLVLSLYVVFFCSFFLNSLRSWAQLAPPVWRSVLSFALTKEEAEQLRSEPVLVVPDCWLRCARCTLCPGDAGRAV